MLDFNTVVLNLIWLFVLYVPLESSFIATQFFFQKILIADLMLCLTKLLLFDISLLYYYTNLNSPIICCLFPGDIYLSFDIFISLLALYKLFWECNSSEDFETLVILFAILLTIILPSLSNG